MLEITMSDPKRKGMLKSVGGNSTFYARNFDNIKLD